MIKLIAIKVLKVAAMAAMYLFIRYLAGFEFAIEYNSHE